MTPQGQLAQQIIRWAWKDPSGRIADARRQLDDMARHSPDPQSLREIGDAATMLSRLEGTLVSPVSGE